ncbi:ribose 5-phosphate isomerase B [Guggenheimella bovis]
MKIILGSDHGGFDLKEQIKTFLQENGHEVEDMGCFDTASVDYPIIAQRVCHRVLEEKTLGMLFCGTGIGISIAANKVKGIRAANVSEEFSARMSRRHNDANVLVMGGRTVGTELAKSIAKAWLEESFEGGRHERRVSMLEG